jgi:hypothetical protein
VPFKPGQSGNPGGRTRDKIFTDALRIAINVDDPISGKKKVRVIAEKLVDEAMAGEPWAVQMVADRIDGKPVQAVEVGGQGEFAHMSDDELQAHIVTQTAALGLSEAGLSAINKGRKAPRKDQH